MLKDLKEMVDILNTTNSSKEKLELLKEYPHCRELLEWTYNPYKKFGITSKQIEKNPGMKSPLVIPNPDNIIIMLAELANRNVTGHSAVGFVQGFILQVPEYKDLIYKIIDKDLQIRLDVKSINKTFPGLIPTFDVALAEDYWKQKKVDLLSDEWLWSRKLDGVRCITRIDRGQVTFYSRKGHEFTTLDVLKKEIERLNLPNGVIDGEVCLIDKNGNEQFQGIMKEIRRKDHTIKNPKYKVFDWLELVDFDSGSSYVKLTDRLDYWSKICGESDMINTLAQTPINSKDEVLSALDFATDQGWEGLILRRNTGYRGKRTSDMLKVKKMYDSEYIVTEVLTGDIDDGHGNKVKGMTAVLIQHKHTDDVTGVISYHPVKVGSGWTHEQRITYYEHPEELIGKVITVKYFEETKNQEGTYSLRFPIVKCIHGDKRDV